MVDLEQAYALNEIMIKTIADYKPLAGESTKMDDHLINALRKHLRHEFIEKFCLISERNNHQIVDDDGALDKVYSNQPLMYIGPEGQSFNASSSEPAFIIHLLSLLSIQPGDRVLEIGCGTGWLLSLIAELVGDAGHATGVEILPELAAKARSVIAKKAIRNVDVLEADANSLSWNDRFDKVIFTTSTYLFPEFLWDCVKDNGCVVIPLRNRGPAEEVHLLKKECDRFSSVTSRFCKFVEMSGSVDFFDCHDKSGVKNPPPDKQFHELLNRKTKNVEFYFDRARDSNNHLHLPFSSFLSKTEPAFSAYRFMQITPDISDINNAIFGEIAAMGFCIDYADQDSLAVWQNHNLTAYGALAAFEAFIRKFDEWDNLGCPSGVAFKLSISRKEPAMMQENQSWLEARGTDHFVWSL